MLKQLVCLAAGVGLGYCISQYQNEKTFQARLDESRFQIEYDLNQEYQRKVADLLKDREESVDIPEDVIPPMPPVVRQAMTDYAGIAHTPPVAPVAIELPSAIEELVDEIFPNEPSLSESPKVEEFVEGEAPARVTFVPPSRNPVQIITSEEFVQNGDDYSEFTFNFWNQDASLSDENDDILTTEQRDEILGEEGFSRLTAGPEAMGGAELYLRNTNLKGVFEIIWNAGAHNEEVGTG